MQFSVDRDTLRNAVGTVGPAADPKSSLPVLSNIYLEADGKQLHLAATDLELGVQVYIPARVDVSGACTVPARTFSDLLATWDRGMLDAWLEERSQTLHIESSNAKAQIKGIPASEFVVMAQPDPETGIELDTEEFRQALRRVVLAASGDDQREILQAVLFRVEGEELVLAAADGFRLSIERLPADPEWADTPLAKGLLIPASALKSVMKALTLDPDYALTLHVTMSGGDGESGRPTSVSFMLSEEGSARVILTSQLIEGNYPTVEQIVPREAHITASLDTRDARGAAKGALIFAVNAANITRWYIYQRTILVHGESAETGEQVTKIATAASGGMEQKPTPRVNGIDREVDGELLGGIALNGRYIAEVLSAMDGEAVMNVTTPSSPIKILEVGRPGFTHVIMPMQLAE